MKRKFMLIVVLTCFILSGCTPIQDLSIDEIIKLGTERNLTVYNKYRKGYKYNVPKGIDVLDNTEYNEILMSKDYIYYLYVDAVSYYNKVIEQYDVNSVAYLSMPISHEDKYGYLEINKTDDNKYFIEIMYNYAKIEVIVNEKDIKETIANSLSVLASVSFNTNVLKTLLDEEVSQFRETEFNIFETNNKESQYLEVIESDVYEEETIHDGDLIN